MNFLNSTPKSSTIREIKANKTVVHCTILPKSISTVLVSIRKATCDKLCSNNKVQGV